MSSTLTVFGRRAEYRTLARCLARAFLLAAAVFVLWPGMDLAVSRWFYVPGDGFPFDRDPIFAAFRWWFWRLSEAMVVIALAGLALPWVRRRWPEVGARHWGFVLLLYAFGPGLIVNGLLKSYWGRARPLHVADFGGQAAFTPPLEIAHECASNCSFVSGEAAGAVAFALSLVFLAERIRLRLPTLAERGLIALALAVGLAGPALRVAVGRHFLSDVVFAALIVFAVALALHWLLFGRMADSARAPR
ncbi:MAG: phosphatase PAP2 family protein [Paracoccaceae bacterium]